MVYAATTGTDLNASEEQAAAESLDPDCALLGQDVDAETYEVPDRWKADISDYDQSLSLISYQAADSEPDPLTTTVAVTTATTTSTTTTTTTTTTIPEVTTTTYITTVKEPSINIHTQKVNVSANSVVFHTYGYGHGVGMSQNGANYYAKYDGWDYKKILSLYYKGTTLKTAKVSASEKITIGNTTGNIVSVLAQIVYHEMGEYFAPEAMKAQAVAAYSLYLYNNGKSSGGMVGKPNPPQNVLDAVRSVLGVYVSYNDKPANTLFYASSGGATASSKDIFVCDFPYLVSVDTDHDEKCDKHYGETKVFKASELKSMLEKAYKVKLTGSPKDWIVLHYGDGGYVASVTIGGQVTVLGNNLRSTLKLRSPKFEFVCT